ncbi:hypothetical protein C2138_07740 [Salinibacterium hongtaonis]|nr:hypothetical protein C2138_07740 [Salinibacterium hongtaonis]
MPADHKLPPTVVRFALQEVSADASTDRLTLGDMRRAYQASKLRDLLSVTATEPAARLAPNGPADPTTGRLGRA